MSLVKCIILAGGYGSRLYPLTIGTSKQLLPVYDKPMIYYPLSTLMVAGIRDILIISTPEDLPKFKKLFGDGSKIGLNISYKKQIKPSGIAESFIIGKDFIGDSDVCLILGDNIFYGDNISETLNKGIFNLKNGYSTIFGVKVDNPNEFGVVEFDSKNNIKKIIEKPRSYISNIIVSGLYFYKNNVINIANNLTPSNRNELEITEINNYYLSVKKLMLVEFGDTVSWIDTGTYASMLKASNFFQDLELKTNKKYACVEEIAFLLSYINENDFKKIGTSMKNSSYGQYLLKQLKN